MAWSYSGNPSSSPLDELRFKIGDTDPAAPIFSDEELEYILTNNGGNMMASCTQCVQAAIAKYGRLKDEVVGGLQAKYQQIYENYQRMWQDIMNGTSIFGANLVNVFAGGLLIDDKLSQYDDTSKIQPKFTKDLMKSRFLPQTDNLSGGPNVGFLP